MVGSGKGDGKPDVVSSSLTQISKGTSGAGGMASLKFEESLVNDVIPFIEKQYRVKADADHRALTGFFRGGYHTQHIT